MTLENLLNPEQSILCFLKFTTMFIKEYVRDPMKYVPYK